MSGLVRDGVRLWHSEAGAGEPPLLFVHGWCCDHTYFAPQVEHFARTHRVVAVDLRGHGRSDKPKQEYTVAGFADDIVWTARELALGRTILVGHSLGAIAALEAAARHPQLIGAAVMLDPSPVAVPAWVEEPAAQLIEALKGPAYADAARQHVEQVLFLPSDDARLKARVTEQIAGAPQHVMASAMEQIFAWSGEAAARACTVPILQISAANPIGDVQRFAELCGTLTIRQTENVGHFNQLLAPEQVNAMIEEFLATLQLNDEGRLTAAL